MTSGVSVILDAAAPASPRQPAPGVALICGDATTVSRLIEGQSPDGSEADLYAAVAAVILRHSGLCVVLHTGGTAGKRPSDAAIKRAAELLPDMQGRLRLSEEPLKRLFPNVDLLVSFASPSLIAGCRSGLKPVQIGRAVIGTEAFTHIFSDMDGFAAALAAGGLAGALSLREYELFDAFRRRVAESGLRPLAARRLADDPIVRACRPPRPAWRLALRSISGALANPFAVWRLLRAWFGATDTR